jgi:spore germination protein YaaH
MKRLFILVILFVLSIGTYFFLQSKQGEIKKQDLQKSKDQVTVSPQTTQIPDIQNITTSVFLPYWESTQDAITNPAISGLSTKPDDIIYFGITPGSNGINLTDEGYLTIEQLNTTANNNINILTVRMTDTDQNLAMLRNTKQQKAIIDDTIEIANKYEFKKILIDFEVSALPFQSLTDQMSDFLNQFATKLKANNLSPSLTIYGDHFYRARPFDLVKLNPNFDYFYIMAYDLHKTQGEAGPNFPLNGAEKYGTDLKTAMNKFLQIIPPQKLVVTFGMYGYDWKVDENKRPLGTAKAKSLIDMKQEFLTNCSWKNCLVTRDVESEETEVDYIDDNLVYHIAWFEDEQSVEKKIEYLKTIGVNHFSFWVWGYY